MSKHYMYKCRHCDKIIDQCRCFDGNKKVIWETCDDCKSNGKNEKLYVSIVQNGENIKIIGVYDNKLIAQKQGEEVCNINERSYVQETELIKR